MSETEIFYTAGETNLLYKMLSDHVKGKKYNDKLEYLQFRLLKIVKMIVLRYKSLSEVYYLSFFMNKNVFVDKDHHKVTLDSDSHKYTMHLLFHENLDKIPLLLNDPILGILAKFRLNVGK
jgi:hypothetical protein